MLHEGMLRLCTLYVMWWSCGSNEGVYGLLSRCLALATGRYALRFVPKNRPVPVLDRPLSLMSLGDAGPGANESLLSLVRL